MEWLRQMSLRRSLFLLVAFSLLIGQGVYSLAMFAIGNIANRCMCNHPITLSVTFIFAVTPPILAAIAFYKVKLKNPLTQLDMGTKRIMENDLDFSITCESKDELGQLCRSFESMRAELLKSNQALWQQMEERKSLNAAFAHDLRTPVTVLKGSALILEKALAQEDLTVESIRESISLITQYSDRIESYIQAMTSIQKLEELAFVPKVVEWDSFTKELESSLNILGTYAKKEIEFVSCGKSGEIAIDQHMVHNVVENLVANALRFTKKVVTVNMSLDDEKITITVLDDGSGFPIEILEKGAAPFLCSNGCEGEHFGMGLYICHLLCGKHGGSLSLENYANGAKVTASFQI